MLIVVSYDISDDKRRRKVAKIMEGYGCRVQYSVFECELDKKKLTELRQRLAKLVNAKAGESVRFYPLTQDSAQKSSVLGRDLAQHPGVVEVV